jgi:hypothetical protein
VIRLAWTGVSMTAASVVMSLLMSYGVLPGWMSWVSLPLLLGGMVNIVIAGAFEARRELGYRAGRRLARAEAEMRRFPVGTCSVHGTVWAGPGAGSVFGAFGDHRWCPLREVPVPAEKTLAAETARRAVPSPEKVLATSLTGPPGHEEVTWHVDRSGVLRAAWPVPSISAEVLAERMSRLGEALERESRKMPPEPREPLPVIVSESVRLAAAWDLMRGLRALAASARRMPHMPECDCGECD